MNQKHKPAIAHICIDDDDKQRVQGVKEHLKSVAKISKLNAGKIGLPTLGELIGMLHDLGKYSSEFQDYLKSETGVLDPDEDDYVPYMTSRKGKVDHSTAGAQLLWRELSGKGTIEMITGQVLSLCIASHHSGLIDCLSPGVNKPVEDIFSKRMEKDDNRTHLSEVLKKVDEEILSYVQRLIADQAIFCEFQEVIRKIVLLTPEKSDKSFVAQSQIGLLVRFLFSCLIDADRTDSADFSSPHRSKFLSYGHYQGWKFLISRLERYISQFKQENAIDLLRKEISESCLLAAKQEKGTYTLTVPTGGGKTLASLRFALHHAGLHGMDRVVYVVPFTSIIDQNAEIARKVLEAEVEEQGCIVLEHHSNLAPEHQTWKEKIISENWDAPVVFTTSVQFLEALFGRGTRGARRMHQLANSVLVFDEVQTMPINCIHLFNNAINFLVEQCGCTVLLCTATQPLLSRVDIKKGAIRLRKNSEIISDVNQLFEKLKRVDVDYKRRSGGWSMEDVVGLADEEVVKVQSCLIIVNTKNTARSLYKLFEEKRVVYEIYHLSTNMCPAHRKSVLNEIRCRLDKKEPTVCISTQLIEAGVDVDFGSVIRTLAGLDSIAQAAGRCNRHGKRATGRVHVVNIKDEKLVSLDDIKIGQDKAERVLNDYESFPEKFHRNCIGPKSMEWYYENYFFARAGEMDYPISSDRLGHDDTLINLLSLNYSITSEYRRIYKRFPNIYLRQSFDAAARAFNVINTPTRGIVVPFGKNGQLVISKLCSNHQDCFSFDLLRQAQQFTVNVFPKQLDDMLKAKVVREVQEGSGILYLADRRYYSCKFGLSKGPEDKMEVLDV